jgi:hypothetical protein
MDYVHTIIMNVPWNGSSPLQWGMTILLYRKTKHVLTMEHIDIQTVRLAGP